MPNTSLRNVSSVLLFLLVEILANPSEIYKKTIKAKAGKSVYFEMRVYIYEKKIIFIHFSICYLYKHVWMWKNWHR